MEPNLAAMTEFEYYQYRLNESQKALMALLAKVESPCGDELSEVLIEALNKIEEMQTEEEEDKEEEEPMYTIRCNNCFSLFHNESELELIEIDEENILVCPKCKTDEYLMDGEFGERT
jgi:hypothetical protein